MECTIRNTLAKQNETFHFKFNMNSVTRRGKENRRRKENSGGKKVGQRDGSTIFSHKDKHHILKTGDIAHTSVPNTTQGLDISKQIYIQPVISLTNIHLKVSENGLEKY